MDSRGLGSENHGDNLDSSHCCQKTIDLQKELDEYMESSSLLEKELEASLDQKEKLIRELRQQNQKLDRENEFIKKKMDRTHQENSQLENEVKSLKIENDNRRIYVRELEQKNDDLERAQRVISESVAGIETLLNQAYERNAVLESELEEMENLRMKLQRVSDEARDLKQELRVQGRVPNGNVTSTPIQTPNDNDNSRRLHNGLNGLESSRRLTETDTTNNLTSTPLKCDYSLNGNTMTPSSRISALNIVGDLLRKVGLERFLCPECSKVRCICPKNDKNISSEQTPELSPHQSDNHRPVIHRSVRSLFFPSATESAELSQNASKGSPEREVKRNSVSEVDRPEKHWLRGFVQNNNSDRNSSREIQRSSLSRSTENVQPRKSDPVTIQKNDIPTPRTLSLFSRGTSLRRSSCPPRPPRSPPKPCPLPPPAS